MSYFPSLIFVAAIFCTQALILTDSNTPKYNDTLEDDSVNMENVTGLNISKPINQNPSSENQNEASKLENSLSPVTKILVAVIVVLLVVMCAGAAMIWRQRRTIRRMLTMEELQQFEMGETEFDRENENDFNCHSVVYDKLKYEIKKSAFNLETSTVIGAGYFGLTYKATLPDHYMPVAVKVPKISDKIELLRAMREIKQLIYIGEHENIIKFVGAYTGEIHKGLVYVVTEFLENGSLHAYLQNLTKAKKSNEEETMFEFYQFCVEISKGMHFLSEKKVIHGALAARNVLLDTNNICKISEFGLSRRLYEMDIYVKETMEPVPWRWMAVESLERSEYSLKSDIWSLGVTFWEIFTFAEQPYKILFWDMEFSKKLRSGFRLPKPECADQSLYDTMLSCWQIDPTERPNTEYFISFFQSLTNSVYTIL